MGKISILTDKQKIILDQITRNQYLCDNFYFTGGTALSEFYLHHRYSDDLDFFSNKKIEQDIIFSFITKLSEINNFKFSSRFVEVVYRFDIQFPNSENIKVDFGCYPYPLIEKGGKYKNGIRIDSLRDIATNKLLTINQRTDIKDFIDLYFLLNNTFTVWDLTYSLEAKFQRYDQDILLLAEDFLKVEDFTALPRMIKPITLTTLKKFYRELAKQVAKKVVVK